VFCTNLNIFIPNSFNSGAPNSQIFMEKKLAIGVDIGGNHINCAAVDLESACVLKETCAGKPLNNQASATSIMTIWASCIGEVLELVPADQVLGVGVAMPGPFDYINGICLFRGVAKYENLYGFNIGDAIISSLDVPDNFKVRFINDASAFAVGEAWAGKASAVRRSVSITLGTGFGSAFIENKIPVCDGPDVPERGCVYHLPFNGEIADESFSTRWFLKNYSKLSGKEVSGVKELAEIALTDKSTMNLFVQYGDNIGTFLAPWLNKFKAEKLIIGGNISNAYNLFGDVFEKRLKTGKCFVKVELSDLKEDAAILGSSYLFNDNFWKAVQHALPLM
jgi:glucokinase